MNTPEEIVNHLLHSCEGVCTPPQLVIVIASDATQCAYRSNALGGDKAVAHALHELADRLEAGEGRPIKPALRIVQ